MGAQRDFTKAVNLLMKKKQLLRWVKKRAGTVPEWARGV